MGSESIFKKHVNVSVALPIHIVIILRLGKLNGLPLPRLHFHLFCQVHGYYGNNHFANYDLPLWLQLIGQSEYISVIFGCGTQRVSQPHSSCIKI